MKERLRTGIGVSIGFLGFVVTANCGPPTVDVPGGGGTDSGGNVNDVPCDVTPILNAPPTSTPYGVVSIRGRAAGATRLVVTGGPNPQAGDVMQDGSFCVDVPVATPSENNLIISVQCGNGRSSDKTSSLMVSSDIGIPASPFTLCDGSSPTMAKCGMVEDCTNGKDDNCNGMIDAADPACSGCRPDALSSMTAGGPVILPGKYEGLQLCPGKSAFFAVEAKRNQTIKGTLTHMRAKGLLDIFLVDTDGKTTLKSNMLTVDTKSVTESISGDGGKYYLQVTGRNNASNTYTLDISVTGP